MPQPDIQQLLRRHVFGTKAERARIEEAMAEVNVTEELAREAATESIARQALDDTIGANKAKATALKWLKRQAKYLARLT